MNANALLLFIITLILWSTFVMLMQSRVVNLIKLLVLQNIALVSYLAGTAILWHQRELLISTVMALVIKVLILPWMFWKLAQHLQLSSKIDPVSHKPLLLFSGILLTLLAFTLSHALQALFTPTVLIFFSLSLANLLLAVLLIAFRRRAISQVIGLLVLENSVLLLSMALTNGLPWLIELGMGFDLLIGVMIFALFLIRIRSTYGTLETQHLEKLQELS